jgi:signal transduction histidine kinase
MISVQDNGVGMDPKYHDLIFDRFNQIVDVNSEVKGGSGLGLTITKHIIDLHNGHIYVESELNKGCKFIIVL